MKTMYYVELILYAYVIEKEMRKIKIAVFCEIKKKTFPQRETNFQEVKNFQDALIRGA